MGLFRKLGRQVERVKRDVTSESEKADYRCEECDARFVGEYDRCPECGSTALVSLEDQE
jgi:rRNA maturation endonuclease Nob1